MYLPFYSLTWGDQQESGVREQRRAASVRRAVGARALPQPLQQRRRQPRLGRRPEGPPESGGAPLPARAVPHAADRPPVHQELRYGGVGGGLEGEPEHRARAQLCERRCGNPFEAVGPRIEGRRGLELWRQDQKLLPPINPADPNPSEIFLPVFRV